MSSLQAALDDVKPKIYAIMENSDASRERSGGQLKAKGMQVVQMLLDKDLATVRVLFSRLLVPHPANRGGQGLDPFDVHTLLNRILLQGFVMQDTAHATCFEKHPNRLDQIDFNLKLVDAAGGMLADFEPHVVECLTVACSHTNAALNCTLAGCESFLEHLCENGCLAKEKVRTRGLTFKRQPL